MTRSFPGALGLFVRGSFFPGGNDSRASEPLFVPSTKLGCQKLIHLEKVGRGIVKVDKEEQSHGSYFRFFEHVPRMTLLE